MKKLFFVACIGIIFPFFFSCQPSKAALAAAKEKAEIAKAAAKAEAEAKALADSLAKEQKEIAELIPIDSTIFADLLIVQKNNMLDNVKIRLDSLSFGADIPDEIIVMPSGKIKKLKYRKSNFVVNQHQPARITSLNSKTKEIFVSCKDLSGNTQTIVFGGIEENDFTFNSSRGGDTIVLNNIIYPYSYGKGNSKVYLIFEEEEGEDIENRLKGESYTPIKLKK